MRNAVALTGASQIDVAAVAGDGGAIGVDAYTRGTHADEVQSATLAGVGATHGDGVGHALRTQIDAVTRSGRNTVQGQTRPIDGADAGRDTTAVLQANAIGCGLTQDAKMAAVDVDLRLCEQTSIGVVCANGDVAVGVDGHAAAKAQTHAARTAGTRGQCGGGCAGGVEVDGVARRRKNPAFSSPSALNEAIAQTGVECGSATVESQSGAGAGTTNGIGACCDAAGTLKNQTFPAAERSAGDIDRAGTRVNHVANPSTPLGCCQSVTACKDGDIQVARGSAVGTGPADTGVDDHAVVSVERE